MLFWTCPECGRECSPALRECPVCPPPSQRQPAPPETLAKRQPDAGILALAHNLETIHALPLAPAPEQSIQVVEHGRSSSITATLVEDSADAPGLSARFVVQDATVPAEQALLVLAEETLEVPVKQTVDSLVRPLVESVEVSGAAEPTVAPVLEAEPVLEQDSATVEISEQTPVVPELSAASTGQILEREQAVEPETAALAARSEVQEPDWRQPRSSRADTVAPEPDAPSAIAAESASPEVQEPDSWISLNRESEQASEAEVPPPIALSTDIAAAEPETPAAIAAELTASEEAQEPDSWISLNHESEQASEAEVPPPIASSTDIVTAEPEVTARPEVQEPDSWTSLNREPEQASEAEAPAPIASSADIVTSEPEVTARPEVQEPDSWTSLNREPEQATEAEVPPPIASSADIVTAEPEAPPAASSEIQEDDLTTTPIGEPVLVSEPEALSAITAPDHPTPEPAPRTAEAHSAPLASQPAEFQEQALSLFEEPASPEIPSKPQPEQADPQAQQLMLNLSTNPESLSLGDTQAGYVQAVQEEISAANATQPECTPGPEQPGELEATEALLGAVQLQAETVVDAIHAELDAERAAIAKVAATFRQSSASLLAAPAELVVAPAPPTFEWIRGRRPSIQPLPPPTNSVGRTAQPHALTLAGPCLSPQLRNATELQGTARPRIARAFPGWVASLMGATLLVLLAITSMQYLNSQSDGKGTTPPAPQTAAANTVESVDRAVEISGLRLATTWTGKQQVRFLVINHSARDLSGVTLQVVVRSSNSASGSAPLLLIQAPLSSLGPNQSKEIASTLDSEIPASALADWQSLKTDVQVLRGE